MSIETEYSPKYVELDDIPVSGPDDYSPQNKRKALFNAETRLELDINGGAEIEQQNVVDSHRIAVMNLATHVLTHAAEDPASVTLGDMADGGGTITEYSSEYKATYNEIVDQINESGAGPGSGSGSGGGYGNFTVTVNAENSDL